ncbi:MAG: chemotaxis protein CheW [Planctomycetota bacterium]
MNANHANRTTSALGGQFLTCRVADEQYGIEVLRVREIIGVLPVTPLPHSHEHVLGVINLRGRVIAVADLRTRFGMPYREPTEESCIIVVEVDDGEETQTTGILVDEVADVCHVEEDQTIDPPQFDDRVDSSCLLGLGRVDGRVLFLLDIAQVLRGERPTASTEPGLRSQEHPQPTP